MRILSWLCLFAVVQSSAAVVAQKSFLPKKDIEQFIVEHLDLSTFRSSFGARRQPGQRTFEDLGETPTSVEPGKIEFKSNDWLYSIRILGRKDYNKDGLEDVAICFTDRALQGSYYSSEPLLLTRYTSAGNLIAVAFQIDDNSCPRDAH